MGNDEKKVINEYETWEYWENKFRGMSESQIEEYWINERKEARSDESILMDFADETPGIRAESVEIQYNRYINAKKQHEIEKTSLKKEVEKSDVIVTGPIAKNVERSEEVLEEGKKKVTMEFVLPKNIEDVVPVIVDNGGKYICDGYIGSGGISEPNNEPSVSRGINDDDRIPEKDNETSSTIIETPEPIPGPVNTEDVIKKDPTISSNPRDTGDPSNSSDSPDKRKPDNTRNIKALGKAIKIGSLGLAGLLVLLGIVTAKDVEYTKYTQFNDYTVEQEVSDLYPEESTYVQLIQDDNGKWIVIRESEEEQYSASQTQNPGKLISDLRERGIAEALGRRAGRQAYDATTEEQRVADEDEINQIKTAFDNQLKVISEARIVLENSKASEQEKEDALRVIKEAKSVQHTLYIENEDLFNKYMSIAQDVYGNPADERTGEDEKYLVDIAVLWYDGQENLKGDMQAISKEIYALQNPEKMFKEPSSPKGTIDTDYYIPPIGPFKGIKAEENEIYDLSYNSNISVREARNSGEGQAQEGIISSSSTENVTLKTTRYGINAFVHNFKSFGKGLLEKITGKNLTDPMQKTNIDEER